ncbi:sensor histidine kinase [Streptomyces sp. NBC_01236]|uniref:sensor histidine kinase n=1 Tax=Streptomyces sp. NBC_01236 TaxID=2903789 RepID=UPI002E0E2D86
MSGCGPESADRRPTGDLTALADLVEGFGGALGPKAVLRRDTSVPVELPHEVQAAAHRVVQEALTNVVRRHAAADAAEVAVGGGEDGTLRVTVRDNGRGGTQLPLAVRGGGFGLVGVAERVSALGGEPRTGPRPDDGWEVVPLLPAAGPGVNAYA